MGANTNYDFSGWATRNNIKCSDGRTIRENAFAHNDGEVVPLVWNHQHSDIRSVVGNAELHNRPEGVYMYGSFNDTDLGNDAKKMVMHGDITHLSIYANQLKQNGGDVIHGQIREVSLVLAGANPGAFIDSVMAHGEESDEEAVIYSGEPIELYHAEEEPKMADAKEASKPAETKESASGETVADVFETLNEKQKTVVYALIGQAIEDAKKGSEGEKTDMSHNVFENDTRENTLCHIDMAAVLRDAKACGGSLKEAFLAHAEEYGDSLAHTVTDDDGNTVTYGIANIDYLFPEARMLGNEPIIYKQPDEWVSTVMRGVHHTPFSRIKSMFADITMEEARAKGYVKGNQKKEEVFSLLKRTTTPTTVYKKQKLDRDDIVDITDLDVVAFMKKEMRGKLDEELARAYLIGDQRLSSDDDKINPLNIRPIWTDDEFYTIHHTVTVADGATEDQIAHEFIRQAVKSRKEYRGSGNPVLFTTEDILTNCLLMEDLNGRVIYDTEEKLRTALRVSKIVTVPYFENLTRENDDEEEVTLMGIIVNLNDYNVGADKGGEVNLFDDFDIDVNQYKYLIETRCSGALVRPKSAIALEMAVAED